MSLATSSIKLDYEAPPLARQQSSRLTSLDALRGFDMMWICGVDLIFRYLGEHFNVRFFQWMGVQMDHPAWEGFHLYDLIMPLFIFVSGVAIPFSVLAKLERGESKLSLHLKVIRRMVLLILLGIVFNGGLNATSFHTIRYGSVLGTIGIGYGFAAIITMNCRLRGQIVWLLVILLGYWAALTLIPVPGYGAGVITPKGCLNAWVDQHFLPGQIPRMYRYFDAVGLLPSIAAISSALLGVFAGHWLRRADRTGGQKWLGLLVAGAVMTALGWVWGFRLPIIKNIWTSSYVVYAAGWSCLLLCVFYGIMDVLGYRKWAFVFTVIGMNSITIYVGHRIIDFEYSAKFLFGGLIKLTPGLYQPLLVLVAVFVVKWFFLYFLYRKKIFLRL